MLNKDDLDKIHASEIAVFNAINQFVANSTVNENPVPHELILPCGTKLRTAYDIYRDTSAAWELPDLEYFLIAYAKQAINHVKDLWEEVAITWLQFPQIVYKRSWLRDNCYKGSLAFRIKKVAKFPPIVSGGTGNLYRAEVFKATIQAPSVEKCSESPNMVYAHIGTKHE